jgi:hypothetical protein
MQSKDLCTEVSSDFIQESLSKHQENMTRDSPPLPDEFVQIARKVAAEFGRRIKSLNLYNPYSTSEPSNAATNQTPRKVDGKPFGLKGELSEKGMIGDFRGLISQNPGEPLVVGLFGPPGSGKTTSLPLFISSVAKVLEIDCLDETQLVYYRSPYTEHWDGYIGQPIVVMDDFGQDPIYGLDFAQFDLVVNDPNYLLPMADLDNKGRRFTSQVIILTSNLRFGQMIYVSQGPPTIQVASIWRRIHLPFLILKSSSTEDRPYVGKIIPNFSEHEENWEKWYKPERTVGSMTNCGRRPIPYIIQRATQIGMVQEFEFELRKRLCERIQRKDWIQTIEEGEFLVQGTVKFSKPLSSRSRCRSLKFPKTPPADLLGTVRVVPLPEPLKCRIITAGSAETRCLKPFQRALHRCLQTYPEFCLTGGGQEEPLSLYEKSLLQLQNIERECQRISRMGRKFLSGDYTAATDSFPLQLTSILLEEILNHIDHPDTIRWAWWEISPKELIYPSGERVYQRCGQLMGSILSFPLLCLANKALCEWCEFDEGTYTINGDDLLASVTDSQKDKWFRRGGLIGLVPSIGKTYYDEEFGTINSQLFFRGGSPSFEEYLRSEEYELISTDGQLLHTGKLSLICRNQKEVGETFRCLQQYYRDVPSALLASMYRSINSIPLSRTIGDLGVSYRWGGLGQFNCGNPDTFRNRQVYLVKLYKKCLSRVSVIPGFRTHKLVSYPYVIGWEQRKLNFLEEGLMENGRVVNRIRALSGESPEDEDTDNLSPQEFRSILGRLREDPRVENILRKKSIYDLPPLDCCKRVYHLVPSEQVADFKKRVQDDFLTSLEFSRRNFVIYSDEDEDEDLKTSERILQFLRCFESGVQEEDLDGVKFICPSWQSHFIPITPDPFSHRLQSSFDPWRRPETYFPPWD